MLLAMKALDVWSLLPNCSLRIKGLQMSFSIVVIKETHIVTQYFFVNHTTATDDVTPFNPLLPKGTHQSTLKYVIPMSQSAVDSSLPGNYLGQQQVNKVNVLILLWPAC